MSFSSKTYLERIEKTITFLSKSNNPKQHVFINNNGLAYLARLLFYEDKNLKAKAYFKNKIETHFGKEKATDIFNSLRRYQFTSFYTPHHFVKAHCDTLQDHFSSQKSHPRTILEPCAGNGLYAIELAKRFPNSAIDAIEPDLLSFAVLEYNSRPYKNITVHNTTFEHFLLQKFQEARTKTTLKTGETYSNTIQKYDLIATNIPFSELPVSQFTALKSYIPLDKPQLQTTNFFMTQLPELLNTGGECHIIASQSFLNKPGNKPAIEKWLTHNKLIGAVRFNQDFFASENTKVVSDLIALEHQKQPRETQSYSNREKALLTFAEIQLNDARGNTHTYPVNGLFQSYPELINGHLQSAVFHNRPAISVAPGSENPVPFFENQFKISYTMNARENLSANSEIEQQLPTPKPVQPPKDITSGQNQKTSYPIGKIFFHQGKPHIYTGSNLRQLRKIKSKDYNALAQLIHLRDAYLKLENSRYNKALTAETIQQKTEAFIQDYNQFCFQYGSLSTNADKLFSQDHSIYKLRNLEIKRSESDYYLDKNAIHPKRFLQLQQQQNLIAEKAQPKPSQLTSPQPFDIQRACFNAFDEYGYIHIEKIAETYRLPAEHIVTEAIKNKIAFFNPEPQIRTDVEGKQHIENNQYKFQLKNIVLSGNIEAKITALKTYELPYPVPEIETQNIIKELENIKNERIPIDQIIFDASSSFIPKPIKEAFIKETLQTEVEVIFFPSQSKYHVQIPKDSEEGRLNYNIAYQVTHRKGGLARSYKKVFNSLINGTSDIITYTVTYNDGKKATYVDKKATEMAQLLQDQLNIGFQTFVRKNEDYSRKIENHYYNSFLANVSANYDGSFLRLPKTLEHEPYKHQRNAALFVAINEGGLADHKVGHGKTLTMALSAYLLIRQKKAQRIIIATKKSVKEQLFLEIAKNIPLNILLLDDKNFNASSAGKTLSGIINSEVQIIIAHHEQLQLFPFDKTLINEICKEKLSHIRKDYELQRKLGLISKDSKALEKGLLQREAYLTMHLEEINALYEQLMKQGSHYPELSDLNIGHIMIDESHVFKNIGYTTRHDRVAGLNRKLSPKKNLLLEYLIRHIQRKKGGDKGVTFFSGTPISNSAMEIYSIMHYIRPNTLKRKGLENFDAFASTFIKKTSELEPNVLGNYKVKERFRYYINVPELAKLYNSFTHVSNNKTFDPHGISAENNFVAINPTENIERYIENSGTFLEDKTNSKQELLFGYKKYDERALKAKSILILTENKKMCVDPLLVNNELEGFYPFDNQDQVKLFKAAKDIETLYHKTTLHKGVQLVFSDIGVPNPDKNYNSFNTLRKILTDKFDIPKEEIGFIHENYTTKKKAIFKKNINDGTIRIAFGSTATLGTGLNIQKRIVGITHLDIPYKPDVFEQRNGRGIRKGNEIAKHYGNTIKISTYGIKDTSDIFMFNLVKVKQFFTEQVKNMAVQERILDSGNIDDNGNVGYHYMASALSGNIEQLELDKLNIELDQLQNALASYTHQINNATVKIEKTDKNILEDQYLIEKYHEDQKLFNDFMNKDTSKLTKNNELFSCFSRNPNIKSYIHLQHESTQKSYFKKLKQAYTMFKKDIKKDHLLLYSDTAKNIAVLIKKERPGTDWETHKLTVHSLRTNLKYVSRNFTTITPETLLRKTLDIMNSIPVYIESRKQTIAENKRKITSLKKVKEKPFSPEKQERIKVVKQKIKEIQIKNQKL